MKASRFATLLFCSLLAHQATAVDAITVSIQQLQLLNPSALVAMGSQPFSEANFQRLSRAVGSLVQILQVATLPYIGNQITNLNGSLQSLASLIGSLNTSINRVNNTLSVEIDLNEVQDAQAYQRLNSSVNQINATAGAIATSLSSFQALENLANLGLQNRINQLNDTISTLSNASIAQNLSDLWNETQQLEVQIDRVSNDLDDLHDELHYLWNETETNFTLLNSSLSSVAGGLAGVQGTLGQLVPAQAALNDSVQLLSGRVDGLTGDVSRLNGTVDSLYQYIDTNIIGNSTNFGNLNVTQLQEQITQNVSSVLSSLSTNVSRINATLFSQSTDLQNSLSGINQRIDDLVSTTATSLDGRIFGNASAINATLALTAQAAYANLSNAVALIDHNLDLLFQNDSNTLYANNTANPGLYNMFSFIQSVDNSGFALSASEHLYVVVFSNPYFEQSPLVSVALAYIGGGVPQKVSLTLQDLSNISVSVRVATLDESVLDTSGNLKLHLIAYGI